MRRWLRSDRRHVLLLIVVVLQAAVLLGLPLLRHARIADGTIVSVAVEPVDPTDIVRGAYVALRYPFESLEVPSSAREDGEAIVVLEPEEGGGDADWRATRIVDVDDSDAYDSGDPWIRLPLDERGELDAERIGTYYADRDRAQELERRIATDGAVADLALDEDGSPSLVTVH